MSAFSLARVSRPSSPVAQPNLETTGTLDSPQTIEPRLRDDSPGSASPFKIPQNAAAFLSTMSHLNLHDDFIFIYFWGIGPYRCLLAWLLLPFLEIPMIYPVSSLCRPGEWRASTKNGRGREGALTGRQVSEAIQKDERRLMP